MVALPWSHAGSPPASPKRSRHPILRYIFGHFANLILYLLIAIFAAIVLYPYMVVTVPSGQVGVLWKRFAGGTALSAKELKDEGLHIIAPWDKIFLYDLRLQSLSETYNAITSDGVSLTATLNIRFRLAREFIPQLHQMIGPNYAKLLGPEVASRMREVISQYTAEQVYSTARIEIQDMIKDRTVEKLGERFLQRDGNSPYRVPIKDAGTLYDTLLHEIVLPAKVISAINRKAEQYYISQEYIYRVEREKKESERKRIEAEGVRDFQQTVSQGISDSYLRWRGIEATLELAKSNNAKVVIIGSGREGLPIILGNVDAPSRSLTPAENESLPGASQLATSQTPRASVEPSNATLTSVSSTPPSASVSEGAPSKGLFGLGNLLSRLPRLPLPLGSRPEPEEQR
jgi:regulator of protease activity HflC (stomatin/prohibitin superfamily)